MPHRKGQDNTRRQQLGLSRPKQAEGREHPLLREARRVLHNAERASHGPLPSPLLRFACARCGRARRASDLVINPLNAGQMLCKSQAACDREQREVERLVKREWGVAEGRSQVHTASVPTGGTTDGGATMRSAANVAQDPTKVKHDPELVRKMLKEGKNLTEVRLATGFGYGTIYKIRDNPDFVPNLTRSAQLLGKSRGPKRTTKAKVETVKDWPQPEGHSLKTRILQVIMDRRDKPFDNIFDVRRAVAHVGENVDGHKVNHILFNLRTQGWVRFTESRGGKAPGTLGTAGAENVITDIKLSSQGWSRGQGAQWNAARALGRGDIAPTAPVNGAPAPEEAAPAPQPTQPPVAPPAPEVRETVNTRVSGVDQFPLMRALISRPTKVSAAAQLLREAGMEDAAKLIEAEVLTLSDLEKEVVAYFKGRNLERD